MIVDWTPIIVGIGGLMLAISGWIANRTAKIASKAESIHSLVNGGEIRREMEVTELRRRNAQLQIEVDILSGVREDRRRRHKKRKLPVPPLEAEEHEDQEH